MTIDFSSCIGVDDGPISAAALFIGFLGALPLVSSANRYGLSWCLCNNSKVNRVENGGFGMLFSEDRIS